MAKKKETAFKEKVMVKLREIPSSWWVKIQQVGIRGTPDILGHIEGTFVAIELKKDVYSKIDELQTYNLNKIRDSKGISFIMYPENEKLVFNQLLMLSKKDQSSAI